MKQEVQRMVSLTNVAFNVAENAACCNPDMDATSRGWLSACLAQDHGLGM